MTNSNDPYNPFKRRAKDRRSGLNRRWIKAQYTGEDRRSGNDRRCALLLNDPPALTQDDTNPMTGFEKLVISGTIQLEALIRLLIEKKIIGEQELYEVMKTVQTQYQQKDKP